MLSLVFRADRLHSAVVWTLGLLTLTLALGTLVACGSVWPKFVSAVKAVAAAAMEWTACICPAAQSEAAVDLAWAGGAGGRSGGQICVE